MSEGDATGAMDAFLRVYQDDLREGRERELADYQEMFPGRENAVAAAWRECHEDSGPAADHGAAEPEIETIGAYEVVRELGRGGQGVVYLARDSRLRREVALKVFPRTAASPLTAMRMRREAEALSRIDDRGICSVYEFGETSREAFIAMRYVRGSTLADEIRAQVREPSGSTPGPRVRRVLRIIEEVARSIHKAHVLGIVHRDLKPGNVMIDPDDHPVVLDFGLARDEEAAGPTLTQTGDVLGTPAYMPPEQISGRGRDADPRSDVYSLGVCLYECLTLTRPFAAPTREELTRRIISDEPPDPRQIDRRIPRDAATVTAIAMSKDLRRRYASALDLAEDLRRVQAGEPILARRPGIATRAILYLRRRPLQSALVGTAVVAILLGGYLAFRWSDLRDTEERRRAAAIEDALEVALDSVSSEAVIEASLARLDAAEKAGSPSVDVAVCRVMGLVRINQAQKAIEILDGMRDLEASNPVLKWARWRALLHLHLPEAQTYRKTLGEPPDALSALIVGQEARETYGRTSSAILKPEIDRITRAMLTLPAPRRAFHLLLVGLAAEAEDTATAKATAEAMVQLWPAATSSWIAMGYACQRPDPVGAIRYFKKAVDLGADPRAQGVTILLANAYSEVGDEEMCIRAYQDALATPGGFSPINRALALYNLGESQYELCDWEASIESNRRALEIVKGAQSRLAGQAWCNLAESLIHVGRLPEAHDALERGHAIGKEIKGWPNDSGRWLQLMELHQSLAARVAGIGDSAPPEDDATIAQWAAAAVFSGNYATAARWFRRVHGPEATVPNDDVFHWSTRYFAIASAIRAAEGEGVDAGSTDAKARSELRELGFGWLAGELDFVQTGLEAKSMTPAIALRRLERWTSAPAWTAFRTESSVSRWPEAQRARAKELWSRWKDLVARVRPAY